LSGVGRVEEERGRAGNLRSGRGGAPASSIPTAIRTHGLAEPALLPKLMQGITTELLGQDGIGRLPCIPANGQWRQYTWPDSAGTRPSLGTGRVWGSTADRLAASPTGPNLALLVPPGKRSPGGDRPGKRPRRFSQMQGHGRSGPKSHGRREHVGISLGMIYMPCYFFPAGMN